MFEFKKGEGESAIKWYAFIIVLAIFVTVYNLLLHRIFHATFSATCGIFSLWRIIMIKHGKGWKEE